MPFTYKSSLQKTSAHNLARQTQKWDKGALDEEADRLERRRNLMSGNVKLVKEEETENERPHQITPFIAFKSDFPSLGNGVPAPLPQLPQTRQKSLSESMQHQQQHFEASAFEHQFLKNNRLSQCSDDGYASLGGITPNSSQTANMFSNVAAAVGGGGDGFTLVDRKKQMSGVGGGTSATPQPPSGNLNVNESIINKRKCFIRNIGDLTTKSDLLEYFSRFGKVIEAYRILKPSTGESEPFGFVTFGTDEAYYRALSTPLPPLHGSQIRIEQASGIGKRDIPKLYSEPSAPNRVKKLVVKNLSHTGTTKESLKRYFLKFGKVTDVNIMLDRQGKSRGFAFVTFTSADEVDKVLLSIPHSVDGAIVDVAKFNLDKAVKYADENTRKIHVSNLAPGTTERDLKATLSKFGIIVDCIVIKDTKNYIAPDFGLVSFSTEKEMQSVLDRGPHVVKGAKVTIRPSGLIGGDKYAHERGKKLCVNGLPKTTTTSALIDYFSKFGTVTDCVAMKSKEGRPLGFGLVAMATFREMQAVLSYPRHVIDNVLVEVRVDEHDRNEGPKDDTVFIGGTIELSEAIIKDYFEWFGIVTLVEMRAGGYSFVRFESREVANTVANLQFHLVGNTLVEAKPFRPKPAEGVGAVPSKPIYSQPPQQQRAPAPTPTMINSNSQKKVVRWSTCTQPPAEESQRNVVVKFQPPRGRAERNKAMLLMFRNSELFPIDPWPQLKDINASFKNS